MDLKDIRVCNFKELHEALSPYRKNNSWLFRGHSNPDWALIPKAGRPPYIDNDDEKFFRVWKRKAIDFIDFSPSDDWDWLAIAQHHGLATRLLDWTCNPLNAAFFAVEHFDNSDAVIYAYLNPTDEEPQTDKPFEVQGIGKFKPRGLIQRIVRQSGIFTIHNPANLHLEDHIGPKDKLEKIVIDRDYRQELLFELSFYGVNQLSLFPDLDGLSRHSNWYMENKNYWLTHDEQHNNSY